MLRYLACAISTGRMCGFVDQIALGTATRCHLMHDSANHIMALPRRDLRNTSAERKNQIRKSNRKVSLKLRVPTNQLIGDFLWPKYD